MGEPSTSAFYTKVMFAMNGPVQEVRGKIDHDRQLSQLLQDLACGDGRVVGSAAAYHTIGSLLGSTTGYHTKSATTDCHNVNIMVRKYHRLYLTIVSLKKYYNLTHPEVPQPTILLDRKSYSQHNIVSHHYSTALYKS